MNQNHKRKRSAVDDSDDEEPALGKQVLPVANLPHDFSGEPMDGLQYLFTVRYVASHFGMLLKIMTRFQP